jgi:hypothetical protein
MLNVSNQYVACISLTHAIDHLNFGKIDIHENNNINFLLLLHKKMYSYSN